MREMTYGWPVEMLVKAARAHYHIVELPVHYRHRSHGRSKVAGTITGSIKNPLVRRPPYMYEDDPLRQQLAQQVNPPTVRRSSRYQEYEYEEE